MENRKADCKLRLIERQIQGLDKPIGCQTNALGQRRTILPNSKVRELENLITKLAEAKAIIEPDDEMRQEWLQGIGQNLKERVNLVFNPHSAFIEEIEA